MEEYTGNRKVFTNKIAEVNDLSEEKPENAKDYSEKR